LWCQALEPVGLALVQALEMALDQVMGQVPVPVLGQVPAQVLGQVLGLAGQAQALVSGMAPVRVGMALAPVLYQTPALAALVGMAPAPAWDLALAALALAARDLALAAQALVGKVPVQALGRDLALASDRALQSSCCR